MVQDDTVTFELNHASFSAFTYVYVRLASPNYAFMRCRLYSNKLEDLKVLRRSPDLLNNVKIGQGQLQLLMEQTLFLPYTFWSSDLNNLMNNPSNSPVISEKKIFR